MISLSAVLESLVFSTQTSKPLAFAATRSDNSCAVRLFISSLPTTALAFDLINSALLMFAFKLDLISGTLEHVTDAKVLMLERATNPINNYFIIILLWGKLLI